MDAGAGGAGSIFQGAQHEAGENSGVGPVPADINMVDPPSHELRATRTCATKSSLNTVEPAQLDYRWYQLSELPTVSHALARSSARTLKSALGVPARPLARLLPFARLGKNLRRQTITKNYLH